MQNCVSQLARSFVFSRCSPWRPQPRPQVPAPTPRPCPCQRRRRARRPCHQLPHLIPSCANPIMVPTAAPHLDGRRFSSCGQLPLCLLHGPGTAPHPPACRRSISSNRPPLRLLRPPAASPKLLHPHGLAAVVDAVYVTGSNDDRFLQFGPPYFILGCFLSSVFTFFRRVT